jgi:hypothetical protein
MYTVAHFFKRTCSVIFFYFKDNTVLRVASTNLGSIKVKKFSDNILMVNFQNVNSCKNVFPFLKRNIIVTHLYKTKNCHSLDYNIIKGRWTPKFWRNKVPPSSERK